MAPKRRRFKVVGLRRHPDSEHVAKGIARCIPLAIALSCDIFRFSVHAYATQQDVVTGEGACLFGARYTPRGTFAAIYGSLDPETALAEAFGASRRRGKPDADDTPKVLVAVRVTGDRILNLTDGVVRKTLGISKNRLTAPWLPEQEKGQEALTQTVGRLAREAGFQAILYESVQRRGGTNLVVFPDQLPSGQLALVNRDLLPARRRRKTP